MEKFLIITVLVILFFVVIIYIGYKTNKKKENVKLILSFTSYLIQKKNDIIWNRLQQGSSATEDKFEEDSRDRFKELILGLSNVPDKNDMRLHNPDDFIEKIYPFLKEAFVCYKKGSDLDIVTSKFFENIQSI